MTAEIILKFLEDHCHWVVVNVNDIFTYAADSEDVDIDDLDKLLSLYERYGDDGVYAFMSHRRKQNPLLVPKTENYKNALAELRAQVEVTA